MRLAAVFISLPLFLGAGQVLLPLSLAKAEALTPAQATQLLAKAQSVDAKCQVLAGEQAQSLKDLVARAELSLAEKGSVAIARKAITTGHSEGKLVTCDGSAQKLVNDVFAAASTAVSAPIEDNTLAAAAPEPVEPQQQAIATATSIEPAPTPAPQVEQQVAVPKARKPVAAPKVAVIKPLPKAKTVKQAASSNLQGYGALAEKYYVATRCGGMDRGSLNALYATILQNHKQALAANRASDVRQVLKAAEGRAGSHSCS